MSLFKPGRLSLGAAAAVWLCSSLLLAPASAAMRSASIDPALYGNLDLANVDGLGGCACGPTSAVNSMVYLQNERPDIYDTMLMHYEDDITDPTQDEQAAVATILAGAGYMDTANQNGTFTIPEPQTIILAALAACGLMAVHFRRKWG